MLSSGGVGFPLEGQYVVYAGELGGLAYLALVVFGCSFDDCLPDVLGQRLVCICCMGQFTVNPYLCDLFISVYLVIHIPSAFCQHQVGLFDVLHVLVGSIDGVAAQLDKLSQVAFCLLRLSHHGSDPNRWVGYFHGLFWCGCSVGYLE